MPKEAEQLTGYRASDGQTIFLRKWDAQKETRVAPKAVVQIAHGMMEHSGRYGRFAEQLCDAGYVVYANDHRGHGRTAGEPTRVGMVEPDVMNRMVDDLHDLTEHIREEHSGVPVYLFGHSMGSFLAKRYMSLYGSDVDGVILSGTNGTVTRGLGLAIWLARRQIRRKGPDAPALLLQQLTFGNYNKRIKQKATGFDWLTRNRSEIDQYIADPYCGVVLSNQFYYDFFRFLQALHDADSLERIPKELPVYIFAGAEDPVGNYGKGIVQLVDTYRRLGLRNVSHRLYEGGRHEMLNEENFDSVTTDVLAWLSSVSP